MKHILWFIFMLIYVLPLCTSYTNFSSDYTVYQTKLETVFQDYADKLLALGEDLPRPCRRDICYATVSEDDHKGKMFWPETLTSYKVELRCPFSFKTPVYATRVCALSDYGYATWEESSFLYDCPDPPMAELLKGIEYYLEDAYEYAYDEDTYEYDYEVFKPYYVEILRRIAQELTDHRNTPIFWDDVDNIWFYFVEAMYLITENQDTVSLQVAKDFLFILSNMMDDDLKMGMPSDISLIQPIVDELPYKLEKNASDSLILLYPNVVMYVISINDDTPDIMNITEVFTVVSKSNDTLESVGTPNVTVDLSRLNRESNNSFDIAVTIIKEAYLLHLSYDWVVFETLPGTTSAPRLISTVADETDAVLMANSTVTSLELSVNEKQPNNTRVKMVTENGLRKTSPSIPEFLTSDGKLHTRSASTSKMIVTTAPNPKSGQPKKINKFRVAGSTIFVTSSNHAVVNDIEISYTMFDACKDTWNIQNCHNNQRCARGASSDHYEEWQTSDQHCIPQTLPYDGYMSCRCGGLGAFGVFYKQRDDYDDSGIVIFEAIEEISGVTIGDLSSFFNFLYRKELDILGHVLGIISLVCLLLTVISYMVFRRTRKGAPTIILLNLCFALICLSCLLLVIYFSKETITMKGCAAINIFRYYLVFVTLLWNGIEAFNMYMMLVRVFKSDISNFGIKAGIIAWGVPLVMIGACFFSNRKSFNGQHVLVSEEMKKCAYKCYLRNTTLYYGYLIPMGVIIIHNLIMFAFVLKTILKHGNNLGKEQKKNRLVQLIGAVATLVLLGVPWLFSAFGAIDASKSMKWKTTEIVFQVIFVVFVNLQGLFIFIFHCARNVQIRESWSSLIKESPLTTKDSLSNPTPRVQQGENYSSTTKTRKTEPVNDTTSINAINASSVNKISYEETVPSESPAMGDIDYEVKSQTTVDIHDVI